MRLGGGVSDLDHGGNLGLNLGSKGLPRGGESAVLAAMVRAGRGVRGACGISGGARGGGGGGLGRGAIAIGRMPCARHSPGAPQRRLRLPIAERCRLCGVPNGDGDGEAGGGGGVGGCGGVSSVPPPPPAPAPGSPPGVRPRWPSHATATAAAACCAAVPAASGLSPADNMQSCAAPAAAAGPVLSPSSGAS